MSIILVQYLDNIEVNKMKDIFINQIKNNPNMTQEQKTIAIERFKLENS